MKHWDRVRRRGKKGGRDYRVKVKSEGELGRNAMGDFKKAWLEEKIGEGDIW